MTLILSGLSPVSVLDTPSLSFSELPQPVIAATIVIHKTAAINLFIQIPPKQFSVV